MQNLIHVIENLIFCHFALDFIIEVARTELGDNIGIVFGGVHLMKVKNVG
jgi:hypothetical protein